ncbi:MAG: glycosyltransferase involved in cell wall biosynthesis [Planctomycetota bacterium]|jgi:glycosyltransferase involved in cell wall biosynthesis
MRVMLLTPGTGHFYCGSCLRDDTLGQALQTLGHEVTSVPLYLPLQLEREQQEQPVHMGGINVYLQQKSRLARYLPSFVSKWLDRPSILRWASRRGNMTDASGLGPMTVSILRGESGKQALEVDKLIRWIATQPKPDVVIVSNAMLVGIVRRLRESLGVPILVTLQGETPFLDALSKVDADAAWQALRERTAEADALIAVSETYAKEMRQRLGNTTDKLHVVHNGIDTEGFAPAATSQPGPKTIGYLARMCRDKGLDTLVDAFLILKQRGSVDGLRLRVAGVQLAEDQSYVRELQQRIASNGFADDAEFRPNIDRAEKVAFLHTLTALSVPARYQESFGLYLLEAMAAGVPVVQPRHAAFPEIVEATRGGVLCEPDDPDALANALESVLTDEILAQTLGQQGRMAVRERFTAEHMAQQVAEICERLVECHVNE